MAKVITTNQITRTQVKLPNELAKHPNIDQAEVTINEDLITFKLPPANPHESTFADLWQYVHHKKVWVQMTFIK